MSNTPYFYYCRACKKAVPMESAFCDGCGRYFRKETPYRMEVIEKFMQEDAQKEEARNESTQKEASQDEQSGNQGAESAGSPNIDTQPESGRTQDESSQGATLTCPICGRTYDEGHTVCDDCGMALMMVYTPVEVPEEAMDADTELIFGKAIEQPDWEVRVTRHLDNRKYDGSTVVINHEIMPVGRRYFVENNVFASDKEVSNSLLKRISRDNGFFIVENGQLFIQYDRTQIHGDGKKSKIKVNGKILGDGERQKLVAHDIIVLGSNKQSDMDYCVEMEVLSRGGDLVGSQAAIAHISENINLLLESAQRSEEMHKQTYEQVKETAENVRRLSDLSVSRFESLEQFITATENYEKNLQGGKLSKEEYIDLFLKDYPMKQELLASLTEAQAQYLYFAAFYETMAIQHQDADMDYSAAFIYLGKLLENFAHQTLIPLIQKYAPARWTEMSGSTGATGGNKPIDLGNITRSFIKWENNKKMCRDDIIVPMARDYLGIANGPVDNQELRRIRKSFMDCDKARGYRNNAAHSSLEAIFADDLQTITLENYKDAKKNVIDSGFLINIHAYYAKTIGVS